jgi:SAM-dependent methyltransferase
MGGPSQTRSPESLLRNFEYLHKDWGWRGTAGDDENINAIAAIQKVAPGPLGRTLVLGSGASRLAYDLHKDEAEITVALDNDPLLVLVAKRIVAGETIELVEAPTEVTQMSQLATTRNLCAPRGAVHGIHFLLANGLMPPFKAAQFDTVVTPWFIDQATSDAHADMSSLLAQISRVLRPGGQWICQGPLVYRRHTPAANRYTQEELFALIAKAGFALGDCEQSDVAHLRSPLGGFGRFHRVLTFVAKRPG